MTDNQTAVRRALDFIDTVELPPPSRKVRNVPESGGSTPIAGTPAVTQRVLDEAANQGLVVGSSVVSFVAGVSEEARADIINCTLLAQLAAKKKAPDPADMVAWYNAYFDALSHMGWVIQQSGFSEYVEKGDNFEANKAIIALATTLMGPGATALAVITATLDAMQKSSEDQTWLTVFRRESQNAQAAHFQVALAQPDEADGFLVALMAFDLRAKTKLTQVLFFRHRKSKTTLRHASSKVSINAAVLTEARPRIAAKIAAYTNDYISALDI